jgi:hypothetical protein
MTAACMEAIENGSSPVQVRRTCCMPATVESRPAVFPKSATGGVYTATSENLRVHIREKDL